MSTEEPMLDGNAKALLERMAKEVNQQPMPSRETVDEFVDKAMGAIDKSAEAGLKNGGIIRLDQSECLLLRIMLAELKAFRRAERLEKKGAE